MQKGFSLITAIFLLVVLAALGAMMVTFFAAEQQSSAINVMGSRAYQAARAGVEWGTFQVTQSQVVGPAFANACRGGITSSSVQLDGVLSPFSLVVSCNASGYQYAEGTSSAVVYAITATASGVGGAVAGSTDYVERAISAVIATNTASGVVYVRETY